MNYLGRQLFPFAVDWSEAVQRPVTYDLNETAIGFGAEYFTPLQTYTVIGWDFALYLKSGPDLLAWEVFADSLVGRLQGFWLPCPLEAAVISAGISTSQVSIVAEDLVSSWNQRPDQHLLFTFADGSQAAAQIQGVAAAGATETVTLTAPLPQAPNAATKVQRLHYVRFAADEEEHDFDAENAAVLKLSCAELPLEYTNAAAGLQPIYLYSIGANAPVNQKWFYTSFAGPVASAGRLYAPWPMKHGPIKHTVDGNSNQVDITAQPDPSHPFSLLAGIPPGRSVWVTILVCYINAPDVSTVLWAGYITNVEDAGVTYIAHCDTRNRWLKSKTPRFYIGSICNNTLFEAHTCKVLRAVNETTVKFVAAVAGQMPVIQVTFTMPFRLADYQEENWFATGFIEGGIGTNYEIRSILASHWDGAYLNLTLNTPFLHVAPGDPLQCVTGCDLESTTCDQKFDNLLNFGGFVDVPDANLSLEGVNTTTAQGNKKI